MTPVQQHSTISGQSEVHVPQAETCVGPHTLIKPIILGNWVGGVLGSHVLLVRICMLTRDGSRSESFE